MTRGSRAAPPPPDGWQHHTAEVNGVRLHYVAAGSGPLVVLLHGFPEFWYAWRHQIPALASGGFRVIAPDLRGYNESSRPQGVRSYRMQELVADLAALIHHAGAGSATLIGHDWGGAIAWEAAARHPELVGRLVVLNAPHPAAFARELRRGRQFLRSLYIFFFQIPRLPEWLLRWGEFALLERILQRDPVREGVFTRAELAHYKIAWGKPGALAAMINYYRAAVRALAGGGAASSARVQAPTLLIWGEQDRYLGLCLSEDLERWVPDLRVERIPEASHWVMADAPGRVNELILGFLRPD